MAEVYVRSISGATVTLSDGVTQVGAVPVLVDNSTAAYQAASGIQIEDVAPLAAEILIGMARITQVTSVTSSASTPLHFSIPYTTFATVSTTYTENFAGLSPTAKNRTISVVNNTNENSGAVTALAYYQGASGKTYLHTNANLDPTLSSQLYPNGLATSNGAGGNPTAFDGVADTLFVSIASGTTLPTTGQFDIYVQET